ncbi:MAG: tetratricopeptide repeat protein [Spirochaetaceae bacterium]|jgi:tetratricopeptide (TPR) repeat protein|nr:tetratricopeptide repeat protein [Spirochaetaceae bacterium]
MLLFPFAVFPQGQPDALLEYQKGNYNSAADICRGEIQNNPSNIESYVVLLWSLVKLRRYDEARTYSDAAAALNRYDVRIIEIIGEINYFQGRNHDALRYFQEYINMAPEGQRLDYVYYYIGEIYIRLGRFRYADIALSTAVHYSPKNELWLTRLGYAQENSGDFREALSSYEKALALNNDLADARRGLERSREALGPR